MVQAKLRAQGRRRRPPCSWKEMAFTILVRPGPGSSSPWYSLYSSFDGEGSRGAGTGRIDSSRDKASCVARRSASSASEWSQGGIGMQ